VRGQRQADSWAYVGIPPQPSLLLQGEGITGDTSYSVEILNPRSNRDSKQQVQDDGVDVVRFIESAVGGLYESDGIAVNCSSYNRR
jgi:hypothetical protein